MGKFELDELCRRKRSEIVKLIEVADVTRQIAEAVDRRDEVAARLLLEERDAPVRELHDLEEGLRSFVAGLPESEAIRLGELLRGAEAENEEEKPLEDQVAQFRRILESVSGVDRQLSLRLGGNQSFYKKFR